MAKRHLKLVTPATVNRTVTPRRRPNAKLRTREYLTEAEVERLMEAAKGNRWGHRDATMLLVAYRHGLRAAELVDLRWDQVEFASATLHVRRVKQGTPSTHPIIGDELRALRRLQREQEPSRPSCLRRSVARHSQRPGSPGWSSARARKRGSASRRIRTCCAMRADTPSRTRATTRGHCKRTSATRTFSTRCGTPSLRRHGLRISGAVERRRRAAIVAPLPSDRISLMLVARQQAPDVYPPWNVRRFSFKAARFDVALSRPSRPRARNPTGSLSNTIASHSAASLSQPSFSLGMIAAAARSRHSRAFALK